VSDTTINLPDWYDEANASDATLIRSFSDVGEFEVEFNYDPGDPSVGLRGGFESVTFSFTVAPFMALHITFDYEQGEGGAFDDIIGLWTLSCFTVKLHGDEQVRHDASPRPFPLSSFPALLKVARDKLKAIEESERRVAEGEQAMYDQHVEEEREEHLAGKHNDGYDHPDCPLCG
jgi:hypothetical protein